MVIETTSKRVETVAPHRDFLTCANRNRHDAMKAGEVSPSPAWEYSSDSREQRLAELVRAARGRGAAGADAGGLSASDLEAAMGDAGVQLPNTVKAVVVEPEAGRVRVSAGRCPTAQGPFVSVDWDWSVDVGATQLVARSPQATLRPGYEHYLAAAAMETNGGTYTTLLSELEKAIARDPDDPKYRFLAGTLCLGVKNAERAVAHLASSNTPTTRCSKSTAPSRARSTRTAGAVAQNTTSRS